MYMALYSAIVMNQSQTPTFERPESWINYGDASPENHGGLFIKWTDDMWKLVETFPAVDVIPGYDGPETDQRVDVMWVEPIDVWVGGEPENGFTECMEKRLRELSQPTPGPTAPDLFDRMGYYVGLLRGDVGGRGEILEASEYDGYEDMVASHGVEEWD